MKYFESKTQEAREHYESYLNKRPQRRELQSMRRLSVFIRKRLTHTLETFLSTTKRRLMNDFNVKMQPLPQRRWNLHAIEASVTNICSKSNNCHWLNLDASMAHTNER